DCGCGLASRRDRGLQAREALAGDERVGLACPRGVSLGVLPLLACCGHDDLVRRLLGSSAEEVRCPLSRTSPLASTTRASPIPSRPRPTWSRSAGRTGRCVLTAARASAGRTR